MGVLRDRQVGSRGVKSQEGRGGVAGDRRRDSGGMQLPVGLGDGHVEWQRERCENEQPDLVAVREAVPGR